MSLAAGDAISKRCFGLLRHLGDYGTAIPARVSSCSPSIRLLTGPQLFDGSSTVQIEPPRFGTVLYASEKMAMEFHL